MRITYCMWLSAALLVSATVPAQAQKNIARRPKVRRVSWFDYTRHRCAMEFKRAGEGGSGLPANHEFVLRPLLADNDVYIKVRRMVCLSERQASKLGGIIAQDNDARQGDFSRLSRY
jgi:hypothetical protein